MSRDLLSSRLSISSVYLLISSFLGTEVFLFEADEEIYVKTDVLRCIPDSLLGLAMLH